jgi:Flp pilus assembly protein TadG
MRMFSGVTKPIAFLAALARSNKGNILPMTAAAIFLVAGMVGGGVDISRAYMVKNRLQNACDAGALAGRHAVTTHGWDATAIAQANAFFNANFDRTQEGATASHFDPASPDDGDTINGTATATLPTIVMNLFGYDSIPLSVTCTASMGVGNSDVMFVLDSTGSMNWVIGSDTYPNTHDHDSTNDSSRLDALKAAMYGFYNTVHDATANTNARIRYAYVPFSSTVNVGGALMALDSSYVADSAVYDARQPTNWTADGDPYTVDDPTWNNPTNGSWNNYTSTHYTYSGSDSGSGATTAKNSCKAALPANGNRNDDNAWTVSGDVTYGSTSHSYDADKGERVEATGTTQNFTLSEYQCSQNTSSNYYYRQQRTVTRPQVSKVYQDFSPTAVTTSGVQFASWLYKPMTIDTSSYKAGGSVTLPFNSGTINQTCTTDWRGRQTCTGGVTGTAGLTSAVWGGCIAERQTVPSSSFTFTSLSAGIEADDSFDDDPYDLNIDMAPTGDTATQWAPLWPDIIWNRGDPDIVMKDVSESQLSKANTYCPYQSQIFEDADYDTLDTMLQDMGNHLGIGTYYDIGLLWGARISSPTGIFADNVNAEPDNGGTVSRHLIFLTDGDMEPQSSTNTSYGVEPMDQRIAAGDTASLTTRLLSRSQAICSAIKARGIRLWVIALSTGLTDDLRNCASPDSSFEAESSDELNEHFQEIAKQVGELRITQ